MLVMLACGALLVIAVVAAWRWRGYTMELPPWAVDAQGRRATPLRGLIWVFAVGLLAGLGVALFIVGPAGRLAMRLLAVTSPEAQGVLTEAEEVVGEITLSGTLGFFVFAGLPFGLAVGVGYTFASFVLPRGPLGGAMFGAAALVIFGGAIDPLRGNNRDFDILGPGWLAVAVFSSMAVLTGTLTATIAGRVAAALGAPKLWWAAWLLPVGGIAAAIVAAAPAALAVVFLGCTVFVGALLVPPERRQTIWRQGRRLLRAALTVAVLVTAPSFISALSSIVS